MGIVQAAPGAVRIMIGIPESFNSIGLPPLS